jgi:hypothetical protein
MAELLNIEVIGSGSQARTYDDIIYRLNQRPPAVTDYRYLIVADTIEQLSTASFVPNLIVVKDFQKTKSFVKNKKYKSKIALEVLLSDIRRRDGIRVGRWFKEITDLYKFTNRFGYQFVISSGANSIW